MSSRLRCAIYTRKSSEEGLDQSFNSLHAQREACEAYVLSQTGEGWSAIKAEYDDGGFSGGSLERPALKRLLQDIRDGLVDIVVVYKVDRLTRSLADFAKIVELFDARGVSFVSVTQAFNTTSSMGRLTLNVLLSFAQFEREVTGERIRDKIAASKAKGLRMGGRPPLGYDIVDGRLAVNPTEAPRVRQIFQRYLELGSVYDLEQERIAGKQWLTKSGRLYGGGIMGRGSLHHLLSNPAYRGVTRHHEKRYEGTHPVIVDETLWDQVQARLGRRDANRPSTKLAGERALLDGKVFDDRGGAMSVVHTCRKGIRYRYYVSRACITRKGQKGSLHRISTGVLEGFLRDAVGPALAHSWRPDAVPDQRLFGSIRSVTLSANEISIGLAAEAVSREVSVGGNLEQGVLTLRLAFHMSRRRGALILQSAAGGAEPGCKIDRTLVRAVVLARVWARELEAGEITSIRALAQREGLCNHYLARLLPLAYLAPDLTEVVLAGRQPQTLTLSSLTANPLPKAWSDQRALFAA